MLEKAKVLWKIAKSNNTTPEEYLTNKFGLENIHPNLQIKSNQFLNQQTKTELNASIEDKLFQELSDGLFKDLEMDLEETVQKPMLNAK